MRKNDILLFTFFSVSLLTAQSLSKITIVFQCDMELEIVAQKFNSITDTLFTRTSINDWSDIVILTPSDADTNIYEGAAQFETYDGDIFYHKFAYTTAIGTNWEGGNSYEYVVTATDITNGHKILPVRGYNTTGGIEGINLHETEIRFIVDMNNAVSENGIEFTSIDNVVITGANPPLAIPSWGWPDSDSNKVLFMSDDGTNGDETADDNFWTKEITFPIYTLRPIQYKYGANWGLASNGGSNNNESSFYGLNHFVVLGNDFWSGDALDKFGIMGYKDVVNGVEQIWSEVPEKYELEQNYPNPFNPSTIINFSIPEGGFVTLKIFNILGQEVAELVNEVKSAGSYEVLFDVTSINRKITTGIYLYKIQSSNFSTTKKMLLIK